MPRHYLAQALCVLACLLMGMLVIKSFADALDRPIVHVSWHSKECVQVEDLKAEHEGRKSEWSCAHMPEKYQRVWVY
ncbi:hypothetical protein P9A54_gp49 [Xanthomonas phage vB_Xar_IVIA-DoCa10]|uniref:Uncharacterized protein n=1 Tax=Xanthomonas phage vB_Xar_IVIA-DoCa10 TaxID=2975529 RepID=A0A9X9JPT2_9CAUD|nr:hypothetical protein P9A54_gp49 [Xanthomonas phage vB_Xar_IVIA-DoCa10]UYA99034.1 hypothetical protein IVIADoCa10_49 [Xanthomonas phage vB_Xar_IVIA-DoCa10]